LSGVGQTASRSALAASSPWGCRSEVARKRRGRAFRYRRTCRPCHGQIIRSSTTRFVYVAPPPAGRPLYPSEVTTPCEIPICAPL
jgi:hypothetical protein